mgnify:CR=1 FL=1
MAAPRLFTVDEADRTLPLVRRIADDIVQEYAAFQALLQTFHHHCAGGETDAGPLRAEIEAAAARINGLVRELGRIGCALKGFAQGIVDFPSTLDGREIWLCWKAGEERVAWWHERDAGFLARQPLTEATTAAIRRALRG